MKPVNSTKRFRPDWRPTRNEFPRQPAFSLSILSPRYKKKKNDCDSRDRWAAFIRSALNRCLREISKKYVCATTSLWYIWETCSETMFFDVLLLFCFSPIHILLQKSNSNSCPYHSQQITQLILGTQ